MLKKMSLCVIALFSMVILAGCGNDSEATKQLFEAIEKQDYQLAETILTSEEDVDLEDCKLAKEKTDDARMLGAVFNYYPLDTRMCELLAEHGADLNTRNEEGATYLQELICDNAEGINGASAEDRFELFKRLLESGADVNLQGKGEYKGRALDYLLSRSPTTTPYYDEMYQTLLAKGAEVTEKSLEICLENESRFLYARPLLERLENEGEEPKLSGALRALILQQPEQEVLKWLGQESYNNKEKLELLFLAAANSSPRVVEALKQKGADMTQHACVYLSLLDIASIKNDPEMIRYLLDEGQELEEWNDAGYEIEDESDPAERHITEFQRTSEIAAYTPLSFAVVYGKKENAETLLEAGAKFPENLWCSAALYGGKKAVDFLLEKGYEPKEYFVFESYLFASDEMVRHMLKRGIDYRVSDDYGTMLLESLKETGNEERYRLIVENK